MTVLSLSSLPSITGKLSYTDLRNAVERYTENTFDDQDFSVMTRVAEQHIYNSVQLPVSRKTITLSLTVSDPLLQMPDDFLSAYAVAVIDQQGGYNYLLNKDVDFLREAYPNPTVEGTPKYYAIYGPNDSDELVTKIIVAPTPNAALDVSLNYSHYPQSIVDVENTWLGDNFSLVLFNAVMVEAARFMKQEADIVAMMDKEYARSLALLKNLADGKNRQDSYRSGQVRNKVV